MTSPAADLPILRALTDVNFAASLSAPGFTLVHFTAGWCQPCARAAADVAGLSVDLRARRQGGRAVVMTADIDDAPHAANAADVLAVPCLVLFSGGMPVARLAGQWPRQRLRDWFDDVAKGMKQ